MEELTKAEERIMLICWRLQKAFVKDVIAEMEENPPYNTVSSVVRILEKKGYLDHETFGNTHRYYPLISKGEYRQFFTKKLLSGYFDDSPALLVSFLVKEENLSESEKKQLRDLIDKTLE
jgi:BlaI family transcriptional regulator, penicillinase repressor